MTKPDTSAQDIVEQSLAEWFRPREGDGSYPVSERTRQMAKRILRVLTDAGFMAKRDRGHTDLEAGATAAMRRWADDGLGFNCTFADDDMRVIVGLAQRAVLAGLASDFDADMQSRFSEAAEKHRAAHESSLGREIKP